MPEFELGLRGEHAAAGTRQRRREDKRADQVGVVTSHRLHDSAADVVSGQNGPGQTQLADRPGDAPRLRGRVLLLGRFDPVLVRLAETAQIRHHDVAGVDQQRRDKPVVCPVTEPAVQQDDRVPATWPPVCQPKVVDRLALGTAPPWSGR